MASSWGGSWGSSWADSWGVLSGAGNVTLAGKRATSAIGLLKPTLEVVLTGQAVAVAYGSLSVGGATTGALTGQSVVAGIGTLVPTVEVRATGVRATVSVGWFAFEFAASEHDLWAQATIYEMFAGTGVDDLTCVLDPHAGSVLQAETDEVVIHSTSEYWTTSASVDVQMSLPLDAHTTLSDVTDLFVQSLNVSLFVVAEVVGTALVADPAELLVV